jgi:cell wall-associated NlpC family hydrolase
MKRDLVVYAARSWLATPWAHQGRSRLGIDCAGLVICVARDLGLVDAAFDVGGYPRVPDGKTLLAHCEQHMSRVEQSDMQPGDVVVARFDSDAQHFGFVVPYRHGGLAIVHAAARYGSVIETRLMFGTSPMSMKFVAAYSLPGVD